MLTDNLQAISIAHHKYHTDTCSSPLHYFLFLTTDQKSRSSNAMNALTLGLTLVLVRALNLAQSVLL